MGRLKDGEERGRHSLNSPDFVVIGGGGRWARVTIPILRRIIPANLPLVVVSPHNAAGMAEWVATQGLGQVLVEQEWPEAQPRAALILNAAADHYRCALPYVERGVPTFVEKPLCLATNDVRKLVDLAQRCGALLAPGHVYRFGRHVARAKAAVAALGLAEEVSAEFLDPLVEQRHGEAKRFDPLVPAYLDYLPHVMAVIAEWLGDAPFAVQRVTPLPSGQAWELELSRGPQRARITLGRGPWRRTRRFAVQAARGTVSLDISQEPGVLSAPGGETMIADPEWEHQPGPLGVMLASFWRAVNGGDCDPRFTCELALAVAALSDEVATHLARLDPRC